MADTMQPISPIVALEEALSELHVGLNFKRFGVPCDAVDVEHLRRAECLIAALLRAQKEAL